MQIKTRLQLSTAASILIALLIFLTLLTSNRETLGSLRESYLYHRLLSKVFALNMLSENFLYEPLERPRAQEQWHSVHGSLGAILRNIQLVNPEEQRLLASIIHNHQDLGAIFSQLAQVMDNPDESPALLNLKGRLSGQLSVKLRMMADETSRLLDASHARIIRAEQRMGAVTISLILLMIGLTALFLFQTSRKIGLALGELQKGTALIAEGNLDHRINVRSDDEIGRLARAFDHMTERLSQSIRSLETEIEERQRVEGELVIHTAKLERTNRHLNDFAFIASHDLQEPLRKIMLLSDRLKSKALGSLVEEDRDYVVRINAAADRMREQIRALLTYSRVTGRTEPFRLVDLNIVVQSVAIQLEDKIAEAGGRLEIGEMPVVRGNADQMFQLFLNLVENALKFRGDEPPLVRIQSQLPETSRAADGTEAPIRPLCQIFVEDNGIGFDEKYQDRIFSPFQRLHHPSQFEGTGIGLAICRKIVESHDGTISAKSTPGKGSVFIIALPAERPEVERPLPADIDFSDFLLGRA